MEYVQGGDLAHYLKLKGRLQEDEVKVLGSQLLDAVVYCHKHHVIHRDIKPENIMLEEEGSLRKIKVSRDYKICSWLTSE
jgi:serine/threonine protein kinase